MLDLKNKNVLVLGLKKSGCGAVRLLKKINTNIFISDQKEIVRIDGTKYIPYDDIKKELNLFDIIVKSPGIPDDCDIIKAAKKRKVSVISEIELAYTFIPLTKVIVGVTGTNGKTTTTSLITQILKTGNIDAVSVGNIGYTLSDAIIDDSQSDVFVVELSSFQLMDTLYFKPHISVILNIEPNHLDYHKSYKNYLEAKLKILQNITKDSILIYNADDRMIKSKVKQLKCQKYSFSLRNKCDAYVNDDELRYDGYSIIKQGELKLLGRHNLANVLAAILTAKAFYIENEVINTALKAFTSLPHRIQLVRKVNGVSYYNDSKATNVSSTISALNAFKQPLVLILGGYDRDQDFNKVINHPNTAIIICYGQTKIRIATLAHKANKTCFLCSNLQEAVVNATKNTKTLEIVLFSPSCASWDQYDNYEVRGEHFISLVNGIN